MYIVIPKLAKCYILSMMRSLPISLIGQLAGTSTLLDLPLSDQAQTVISM